MEKEVFEKTLENAKFLMNNEEFNKKMNSTVDKLREEHAKDTEDLEKFNSKLSNLRDIVKSRYEKRIFNIDGVEVISNDEDMRDFYAFNSGIVKKTDCNNKKKYNYNEKVEKLIESTPNEDVKKYLKDNFGTFSEEENIQYANIVEPTNIKKNDEKDELHHIIKVYIDTLNEYYIAKGYIERENTLKLWFNNKFVKHGVF